MAVRIRLQRHGSKKRPFYRITVADGRARRDGRFIEHIGTYNPLTEPPALKVNREKTIHWLQQGAQMSETVRSLFTRAGITSASGKLTSSAAEARPAEAASAPGGSV
ncbi:MAG: 30S ribosomal protein S16 [Candidatus Tectomicrobia bacterium]|nr:30S ribosomal protein S16 [Candidatus Tectomicrobia bacterium]